MNPEDRLRELQDPERWMNVRLPHTPAAPAAARTRMVSARGLQLVAAFAIAILAVVGIVAALGLVSGLRPVPPAATPSTFPTQTASPSPSPTVSPVPSFAAVPGASHTYSAGNRPSACTLGQLQTDSAQDGGGAAGTYLQSVLVRNTGSDCFLPTDTVNVGGQTAALNSSDATAGMVLPAGASATLRIGATFTCQPSGSANVDPNKPVLAISIRAVGGSRTVKAKYPQPQCTGAHVDGELGVADGTTFASSPSGLEATIDQGFVSAPGPFTYDVAVKNTGTTALVLGSCPAATEVITNGTGTVITRAIALRCAVGATLQPQVPVTVTMSATIPGKGDWNVTWFVSGGSKTTIASTTCTLDSLSFQTQGHGGGVTGNWIELLTVRNTGSSDCVLPASAFVVSARHARAGQPANVAGFRLVAGSSTQLELLAATTCPVGGSTINLSPRGPYTSVFVSIGGRSRTIGTFPQLHCSDPFVDR